MPILQKLFGRWTSRREVWIAVPCSATRLLHWTSCRQKVPNFGETTGPYPSHLGTIGRQRPQGSQPQRGLQHGARQRSRKRLSTPQQNFDSRSTRLIDYHFFQLSFVRM